VRGVRREEGGLVDSDGSNAGEPGRVIDQRLAVLVHRAHHGAPADAERGGDRGDVQTVLADPPARLATSAFGQHRPSADVVAGL
jgi:hypothetical protein